MASAIDATKPVAGNPTTESVRANFAAAKSEIEVLQQTAGVGPKGDQGERGPAGTIAVGTVTTGAAGTSASVTNSGSTTAATLNFTIPRGDAGTGGGGITETQAKTAVAQGNIQFKESPETEAATWATTPNLAQPPVVGANWTPATGGTATQAYTHDIGSVEPLAYPLTIANDTFYQIVFSLSNVVATSTVRAGFCTLYFRNGPTNTTGQQTVLTGATINNTIVIQATANFTHLAVVPLSGWQGTFTLTRVVVGGTQNSATLSIKDWAIRARGSAQIDGGGGRFVTGGFNTAFGFVALNAITSGANNTAIGGNALARSPTSTNNTAIGYNAMANALSGGTNIAIGVNALNYNQTGGTNIAVGSWALGGNYTGSNNIGIGSNALYGYSDNAGGVNWGISSNNLAIGTSAGWSVLGTGIIAIGHQAYMGGIGPPRTITGDNVISIGMNAGRYHGSAGTAYLFNTNNSIYLGVMARPAADAETNQIVIGHNIVGHGSNTITLGNDQVTALHCHVQTISALSDSRVKEDIQAADLNKCLDAVKRLPVSRWAWQAIAGAHPDKHVTGFLADDVTKVFPKSVTKEDGYVTVRDADGKPEMISVTESGWDMNDTPADGATPKTIAITRQIEKTVEIKGLQYISPTELLPTLWGAVQQLTQQVEELRAQLAGGTPEAPQPQNQKSGIFGSQKKR